MLGRGWGGWGRGRGLLIDVSRRRGGRPSAVCCWLGIDGLARAI